MLKDPKTGKHFLPTLRIEVDENLGKILFKNIPKMDILGCSFGVQNFAVLCAASREFQEFHLPNWTSCSRPAVTPLRGGNANLKLLLKKPGFNINKAHQRANEAANLVIPRSIR